MKAREIVESTDVPSIAWKWARENGFSLAGEGDAAVVFKKGNIAHKIYGYDSDGRVPAPDQEMILLYVNYCKQHSDNPYLPKFGNVKYIDNDKQLLAVETELLQPSTDLSEYLSTYFWDKDFEDDPVAADGARESLDQISNFMSDNEIEEFFSTLNNVLRLGGPHGYTQDINPQNIMMRGKTPVINDPWTLSF